MNYAIKITTAMDKSQKIRILETIKSGRLPLEALNLELGVYRHHENGIYRKGSFEISYEQLLKTCDALEYSATLIYFEDKERPYSVWVSPTLLGGQKRNKIDARVNKPKYDVINWQEILTPEIQVVDRNTAEDLSRFFEKE
jgi:hypothetical protein